MESDGDKLSYGTDQVVSEMQDEISLGSPDQTASLSPVRSALSSSTITTQRPVSGINDEEQDEDEEEEEEDEYGLHLEISVTEPEKVGDGVHAYMVYRVSTESGGDGGEGSDVAVTVKRRFSDFLGLHDRLYARHSPAGVIVPPAPEKSVIGMTKVKVGKEDSSCVEFTEKRRAALERYLQRTARHPALAHDPDFRHFLQKEELPRAVSTQALSGAGILRMVNRAADAVNKITARISDNDPWFEEQLQQFEEMENQLRKLHGGLEYLVQHRKEASQSSLGLARSAAMLGSSEEHTALSRALSQLSQLGENSATLLHEQALSDTNLLCDLCAEYIRLLGSARAAFEQRLRCWQHWQEALASLQRRREAESKLQAGGKAEKSEQARVEMHEWQCKVHQGEQDFEAISKTLRKEVARIEVERVTDFKTAVVKYLESLIHTHQQVLTCWEIFLPEAKAIA
uniref:sorting nexin-2-like n=1 Tax=Myxine glutinosa TaxID=7769 RepID=UPI00358E4321